MLQESKSSKIMSLSRVGVMRYPAPNIQHLGYGAVNYMFIQGWHMV